MQTTFDYRGIGEVLKSSQFRFSLESDVTQLTLCPIHGFVSKFELFETETIFDVLHHIQEEHVLVKSENANCDGFGERD